MMKLFNNKYVLTKYLFLGSMLFFIFLLIGNKVFAETEIINTDEVKIIQSDNKEDNNISINPGNEEILEINDQQKSSENNINTLPGNESPEVVPDQNSGNPPPENRDNNQPQVSNDSGLSGFYILDELTFEELKSLGRVDSVPPELQKKIDIVLNTPIVDNTISQNTDKIINTDKDIGDFIRVVCWNIERGLSIDEIKEAFEDPELYIAQADAVNPKKADLVRKQVEELKNADIIILNEVDMGMPRTDYRNIAKDFAEIFGYNYAYGVEFLEVDPARFGEDVTEWSEERILFKDKEFRLIPEQFKGMHGTAIVTRFKLKNVRIVRLPVAYDWFNNEKKGLSGLEIEKRLFARKRLNEYILREIRLGSRMALIADVDVPGFGSPVTIIAAHLENRARPSARKKQILYLLNQVKNVHNPIILAGDFNTSGHDASPLILSKEIKEFLLALVNPLKLAQEFVDVLDFALYLVEDFIGIFWQYTDPTQINIPIINHNAERKVFKAIQHFKFDDNTVFDFRGTKSFSANKSGRLSHSNQRVFTGFKPTYTLSKKFYRSKFKLDWIFVKGFLTDRKTEKEKYRFAPMFGRVYYDFNYYNKKEPLSDHAPISVDLPLNSPLVQKK